MGEGVAGPGPTLETTGTVRGQVPVTHVNPPTSRPHRRLQTPSLSRTLSFCVPKTHFYLHSSTIPLPLTQTPIPHPEYPGRHSSLLVHS